MPDSSHPSQLPSQVLPTQDGWLVVFCAKEKFYRNLVQILGAPELAEDPRFNSFETRLENREALSIVLKQLTRKKTTEAWLTLLKGHVPCAPVNTVEEAFQDPQVEQDDMILNLPHPEFDTVRVVGSPIKISDHNHKHHRGPQLGEHTDELLQSILNLTQKDIDTLRNNNII
jgi:crotonobetainyl-CoA:carnitine CoA-transferase CaiB-like acyl-CoA transferase